MVSALLTLSASTAPLLTAAETATENFDIIKFLDNAAGYVKNIGHYLMILAGVILVIVAVVQIVKGLAGGGRGQVNWVMSIACLLVGGLLIFGGWNMATSVASLGAGTLENIANGAYGDTGVASDGSGATNAGSQMAPTA